MKLDCIEKYIRSFVITYVLWEQLFTQMERRLDMEMKEAIVSGKTALGIEFGSTRIKAVLIGEDNTPIASGSFDWENSI
jgi:activator of 2-hydroxyglutaryl-CoA dehydratase